jgi:predicted DNA-binding protein YlxM (UPF0122 family)
LCEYLFDRKPEKDATNTWRAFAGCFTFNPDCLNQFRLYGKDNNRECTGVSLSFNHDFFERKAKLATSVSMYEGGKTKESTSKSSENKYALFRCIYIDPETKKMISTGHKEDFLFCREIQDEINIYRQAINDLTEDAKYKTEEYNRKINDLIQETNGKIKEYNKKINDLTKEVSNELENLKKLCKGLDNGILSRLFINLRYLTKHVAFKEEQECRIVKLEDVTSNEVNVSENKQQMYLKYLNCSNKVKHIVFGTYASGMDIFRDCLIHENLNIPCSKSKNPFA